jgi:hypothetical protein
VNLLAHGIDRGDPTPEARMSRTPRPRRLARIAAMSGAALAAAALTPAAASAAPVRPAAHHPPGVVGSAITLANHIQLDGYDEATDAAGNAYIGWIANSSPADPGTRTIYLCTLRPGASTCAGGIQHTASLGVSSAEGLRLIVTRAGQVTMVWFHDDTASESGPNGSSIAETTSDRGGPLAAATDVVTNAPSFGSMLDAVRGPDGKIWTISYADLSGPLQLRDGFTPTATHVTPPWAVGFAQLAFAKGKPILTVEKDGAISTGPSYASASGSHWSSFKPVAKTWAVGTNADLLATGHGVRLITAVGDATYRPVISKWTGNGFSHRKLTADHSPCAPATHDAYSDGSGRLVEVANECGKLAVSDYPDDNHDAVLRFPGRGLVNAQAPQIASTSRGTAFVAWSVESGSTGDLFRVVRFRLQDRTTSKSKRASAGKVTVFGPMSCLPAVSTPVRVTARHAHGWTVGSKSLRLGHKRLHKSSLDGSKLTPGKLYKLHGSAVFHHGTHHKRLTATLKFRSCPTG